MQTFYFTFGQDHEHNFFGIHFDKDVIVQISGPDHSACRLLMFQLFGKHWCEDYGKLLNMNHFPKGIININELIGKYNSDQYQSEKDIEKTDDDFRYMLGLSDKDALNMLEEDWNFTYGDIDHDVDDWTMVLHTGGWSENEEAIDNFSKTMYWTLYWYKSERGGHYYFKEK